MEEITCCSHKTKQRSAEEFKALTNRLSRIEGQVRGVRKMIESDAYCTDILTQVSAIQAALNAFSRELLSNHIHTCVADDIRSGKNETIDELVALLHKLMK
ncbi:MAG: metal-sensing transcriptional repressor [Oscillospiraceae bacterium]|nr:metal-sensing transcriptional repressor [Oscillospiraceae bacterium]